MIIEIDGGQHYEDKNIAKDKLREKYLRGLGLRIIRFTNLDILKNIDNVLIKIEGECKSSPALPKGREKNNS